MYKESLAARWDVESKDQTHIEEDKTVAKIDVGMVSVPFVELEHDESSSSSDEDFGLGND